MRQLTQAQLDAELQTGTVDMSDVEIIDGLDEALCRMNLLAHAAVEEALDHKVAFEANLKAQAEKALATVILDDRGAAAVALADQSYDSGSDEASITDWGPRNDSGDVDQSGSEE